MDILPLGLFYPVRATTVIITCSFTKKLQLLGDFVPETPYWGSAPGPRWGLPSPNFLLCPSNNPVRSTPLLATAYHRAQNGQAWRSLVDASQDKPHDDDDDDDECVYSTV